MMEEIIVLYRIESPGRLDMETNDPVMNCMKLQVPRGKEVLLIDIMNYLLQWTQLSSNFIYRVDCGVS